MERTRFLVVGAGISGLAFADRVGPEECVIVEAETEPGGYCRTIVRDGFVWDYSGHFFHFKNAELERELVSRMGDQRVLVVDKVSKIFWDDGTARGRLVDFPFQKNIHQLPKRDFIECLVDLYFREARPEHSFLDMLNARLGKGIAEKFLVPYNEKLYATDLGTLDPDAMGRFFPHADVADIIRNFRDADNRSYNSTFTYPEGGAIQYVHALMRDVPAERLRLGERVLQIDLARRVARTTKREIGYDSLVSSAPFPKLLAMADVPHDPSVFGCNKVLVFNLGFDRKGPEGVHWIYYPQRELSFYRVGFYDNIFGADRMSLYVEIGRPTGASLDDAEVERLRLRVLGDLERVGVVDGHALQAWHSVVLDPAYVHITTRSNDEVVRHKEHLRGLGVHSIGRYGSWTYCSIEDNMLEARALAGALASVPAGG